MISILIPFRSDGGHRDRLLDWVVQRWSVLLPDAEIVLSDGVGEGGVFSRSRARNLAVQKASGDLLIFADGDTTISWAGCKEALALFEYEVWALPYTRYYNLTEHSTEEQITQSPGGPLLRTPDAEYIFPSLHHPEPAVSGVIMVARSAFEKIGGYDERFIGWGLEDRVFVMELEHEFGRGSRVSGPAYHLWHPAPEEERFGQPFFEHNRALYREKCALLGYPPIC